MHDKYGCLNDGHFYPGTQVFINKLDIRDSKALAAAERDITASCAAAIEFALPPYDLAYFSVIHRQLFADIYPWAGELRHVDISKGETHFCNVRFLGKEAHKLFSELAADHYLEGLGRLELITAAAQYYGDINMLHPFREGNGRAQRILFEHIIVNAGFEIFWQDIQPGEWLQANVAAVYCDYSLLQALFRRAIGGPLG